MPLARAPAAALSLLKTRRTHDRTNSVVVTYPPAFRFRSVQTGAIVGACEIDVNGDGNPDRVATLRAVGANVAFADVIADGTFTPALEPDVRFGEGEIEVRLPFGGDASADTLTAAFSGRLTLVLSEGLVTNQEGLAAGSRQCGANTSTLAGRAR